MLFKEWAEWSCQRGAGSRYLRVSSGWRGSRPTNETAVTNGKKCDRSSVVTYVSEIENMIQALRATIDGDVCSRSRVVDALLDLRLEAADRSDLIDLVDLALADCPGNTMVPAEWWRETLDMFELASINPVEPVS